MKFQKFNYLRTFEAAARLGGFAAASHELNITPAAVSHQIKSLEELLNAKLFLRFPKRLELTNSGAELLIEVQNGIEHFERGLTNMKSEGLSGKLVVNIAPSLAQFWLLPILKDFSKLHPQIDLHILSSEKAPDLKLGHVDIRLVHGNGNFPGYNSKRFLREVVSPVCSPSILIDNPVVGFKDLLKHTLLHDLNVNEFESSMNWKRWIKDEHYQDINSFSNLYFDNAALMINAAVEGCGIALGRGALIAQLIKSGKLVRPLNLARSAELSYYTVTTESSAHRPKVKLFRDWIHEQANYLSNI